MLYFEDLANSFVHKRVKGTLATACMNPTASDMGVLIKFPDVPDGPQMRLQLLSASLSASSSLLCAPFLLQRSLTRVKSNRPRGGNQPQRTWYVGARWKQFGKPTLFILLQIRRICDNGNM